MSFDPITQPLRGAHSIEASAGTGKTYSITLLWLRLLIEEELTVEQILVSTFTKAATAELRERLMDSLRRAYAATQQLQNGETALESDEARIIQNNASHAADGYGALARRLADALSAFDLAPVVTLHGFCQSLITRHALEMGSDSSLELVENCDDLLLRLVGDEAMHMTDVTAVDPDKLEKISKSVAQYPSAALLRAEAAPAGTLAALETQILTDGPVACAAIANARSRTAALNNFQKFVTDRTWKAFSEAQVNALDPQFVQLWNRFNVLQEQTTRLPASRMATTVRREFPLRKTSAGVRSFDDILLTVQAALNEQGPEGTLARTVRQRLRAAIIDECQDSDGVQIDVFSTLFLHADIRSFVVIGDPKQSIYRFRGADLASYKKLASAAIAAPRMTVNYRSDQPLVEAINALYGDSFTFPDDLDRRLPTQYTAVTAKAPAARILDPKPHAAIVFQWSANSKRDGAKTDLAKQVAQECARLLDDKVQIEDRHTKQWRPMTPADIAILASSHRELRLVRKYLAQNGIACQSSAAGMGSVFASDEAHDMLGWLELLASLEARGDILSKLMAFLGSPLGAATPTELQRLPQDAEAQSKHCTELQTLLPELQRSGPLPLLQRRLALPQVIAANLPYADGERRFTNWRHLATLLQHQHANGRRSPASLALWLARQIISAPEKVGDAEDAQSALTKLETDAAAIQLVTIHNSKGLEYPVVFCPFLWHVGSRSFRKKKPTAILRKTEGWALNLGSPDFDAHMETSIDQEDEESHRKLYVALTRPRHRLYVGLAPVSGKQSNAAHESPLAKLPGLGLSDNTDTWEATLAAFTERIQSKTPSQATLEPLQNQQKPTDLTLQPPTPLPAYPFDFVRTASFSSLSKSDQDHAHAADRDTEGAANEGPKPPDEDLLKPLGQGGAALGNQLHHLLEEFLGNRKELADALIGHAQADLWTTILEKILNAEISLPEVTPVCLRSLREGCITEMQFHLPVDCLSAGRLAETFVQDTSIAEVDERRNWAAHLEAWTFSQFSGFLQGYIDLIFEHEGRWYVADYKSNSLSGYTADALEAAMLQNNYLLQARLYALALHRHLQLHLPDYEHERHFGGVAYLFVRGFPAQGVWFERPSLNSLSTLGALFPHPRQ